MSWWDNDTIRTVVSVLAFVGTVAASAWAWYSGRNKRLQQSIADAGARIDAIERRVSNNENALHYTPGHAEVTSLRAEISDLRGDMREISGALSGLRRAVDLMNQHLLRTDSSSHD